ncbi:PKD domain-containing protein [Naasia aerilata]|uniref:PKD domain-containing protein n=1 Tax=Naasia aerilata TaxID=1162966 RepID=A0ABN6XM26_9MICO|nr:PKD domain-containing protein [Naasia aerilata]BDZ45936.1 hypothetical protein GCM10025866_18450 [Naasia aerilata]
MALSSRAPWRALSAFTAVAVVAGGLFAVSPAYADTAPAAGVVDTVSTDPLPTVQIDGVVWTQLVVGNTVYVGGSFATARPAGAAAGVNTTPRANVLAYNLKTGELISSFVADTNAEVKTIAVSPDGKRIYLGGSFTTVNGVNRNRMAAVDPTTGAVINGFAPSFNTVVEAIKAVGSTVFVGGNFTTVSKVTRTRGAALNAADGAVLPFAPVLEGGRPYALAVSPDASKVLYAGSFTTLNGSGNPGFGMGAVDSTSGTSLAWAANSRVRNAGQKAAIWSLTTDTSSVYGTAYNFGGTGNAEGAFRMDWNGNLVWLEDCHGDTYSSAVSNGVLYIAGHPHYCSNVGGFPQTDPDWTFQRGLAFTTAWNGNVNGGNTLGYASWEGTPAPDLLNWWPDFNTGTVTGQGQGPWSVAAGGDYVLYGGEFTKVNNKGQQGLVRFATKAIAPNDDGPRLGGSSYVPTVKSLASGMVRVSWLANYDRDNQFLTYKLIRDGVNASPIYTTTVGSRAWFDRPNMAYTDSTVAPGSTHTYRLRVEDPYGNVAWGDQVSITVSSSGTLSNYAAAVLNDGAKDFWRMGESSGTAVSDWAGNNDAVAGTGVALGQSGAISGDSNTAAAFSGDGNGLVAAQTAEQGAGNFAIEAWFKTTSTVGGKVVGFGNAKTGNSTSYDRHIYLDASGRIFFGVYPGNVQTINTGTGYNNGQWHHVVASLSGTEGMALYVDGLRVGSRPEIYLAQGYTGYWRIGGDSTWAGANYLNGSIDDVAVYGAALTADQVRTHYTLSGRTVAGPAAPTDNYGAAVFADHPENYWRLNDMVGASAAADYSGRNSAGSYSGGVTKQVAGIGSDPAASFDGVNGLVSSSTAVSNPANYSLETWFKTTTTTGGKIIGFGSSKTGASANYDRHVYMQNDGKLVFGTNTNVRNVLTTSSAYNDGAWHYVVAAQSNGGMRLYVDGVLQGSNAVTGAQNYTGYWRVGGDTTWGSTSAYLRGTIDEAAVYSYALSSTSVAEHYQASGLAPVPNKVPTASFTTAAQDLAVSTDASASTDSDGTISSYAWTFGDGGTATGKTAAHTYAAAGTYTIALTVTDDDGATAQTTRSVSVTPANVAPTAAFTATPKDLVVTADAGASSDSDGTVASYAWTFGDGGTATGTTATHSYAAAGTYTVTLTVKDDDGATGTVSHDVTVSAPAPGTDLAKDGFGRTVTGGLGSAETGGAWTTSGTASNYSVDGAAKIVVDAGATRTAYLGTVSSPSTEVTTTVGLSGIPTAGSAYASVLGRRIGTEDYRARTIVSSTGAVQLQLQRTGTTLKTVNVTGLTVGNGDRLQVRVQVTGTSPTTIQAKVWKVGTTEPTAWQVTTTDSTDGLQAAGSIGIAGYLSASATPTRITFAFDDLWAGAPGTTPQGPVTPVPPANVAPTASFTSSTSDLTASVDGSASADSDGTIASYAWAFGDGATGTGAKAGHTYATAGTYTVTLTVTDDKGATASTTGTVTVTAPVVQPPADAALASDDFARVLGSGWGSALTGGAWTASSGSSTYSVNGVGRISVPAAGREAEAYLTGVSSSGVDVQATATLETAPTGGGTYVSVIGRRIGTADYRTRVIVASTGAVSLQLRSGATTLLTKAISGLTAGTGDQLRIRLQVVGEGTTTLRAKVWKVGTAEPTTWQVTATDAAPALQGAGFVGLGEYLSGSSTALPAVVAFDDFVVTAAQ